MLRCRHRGRVYICSLFFSVDRLFDCESRNVKKLILVVHLNFHTHMTLV